MLLEMMKEVVGDDEGGPAGPLYIGTASSDAIRFSICVNNGLRGQTQNHVFFSSRGSSAYKMFKTISDI